MLGEFKPGMAESLLSGKTLVLRHEDRLDEVLGRLGDVVPEASFDDVLSLDDCFADFLSGDSLEGGGSA